LFYNLFNATKFFHSHTHKGSETRANLLRKKYVKWEKECASVCMCVFGRTNTHVKNSRRKHTQPGQQFPSSRDLFKTKLMPSWRDLARGLQQQAECVYGQVSYVCTPAGKCHWWQSCTLFLTILPYLRMCHIMYKTFCLAKLKTLKLFQNKTSWTLFIVD